MTGPEHYREAEALLDEVSGPDDDFTRDERIAMAQVHATLALAAATADCMTTFHRGWDEALDR